MFYELLSSSWFSFYLLLANCFLFSLFLLFVIWSCDRDKKSRKTTEKIENELLLTTEYPDVLKINRKNLSFSNSRLMGGGAFSERMKVFLKTSTTIEPLPVAIKNAKFHDNATQKEIMNETLIVMSQIGNHQNIVALLGASQSYRGTLLIVKELLECGDLKNFIYNRRAHFNEQLLPADLLSFAYQIASGMEYLGHRKVIHCDLALRNVLVKENKIIRIAGFELARKCDEQGVVTHDRDTLVSPYWMAPESIPTLSFTGKSDIWSFGTCIYEIFSLGENPFPDKICDGVRLVVKIYEKIGFPWMNFHLEQSEHCTLEIYEYMRACRDINPENRPEFQISANFFYCLLEKEDSKYFHKLNDQLQSEPKRQLMMQKIVQEQFAE